MPTQLSFPVTRAHQLLPALLRSVTSRAVRLLGPRPGPAQVTRVSRLRPCFPTPCLVASRKKRCGLIFPGRSFISIPHLMHTLTHRKRDGVNLFILLADFCFSCFLFLSAVHPSTDPQKPDSATKNPLLFSKLHLNNSSLPPPHSFAHSTVLSIYSSVGRRGPAVSTAVLIDQLPLERII